MTWPARWRRLLITAMALVATALACPIALAQSDAPRTVLAIHWSTEDYPVNPITDVAIREALLAGASAPIDYFSEYLESDRFPAEEATQALRDYIRRKYQGRRIDLVIGVTDVALGFVLRFREELFPGAPIVYRGTVTADPSLRNTGAGLTGVMIGAGFRETLELALKLHPATEQAFVVIQAPDRLTEEMMRAEVRPFEERLKLTYIAERSLARLLDTVRAAPRGSLILYIRHSQEEAGRVLYPSEAAKLVAEASPVPVYATADNYIGSGVVGGAVYRARALGTRVGEMAREILSGTRPQDIPIEAATPVPMFDWRQLRRWGIAERSLPTDAILQFRELSVWERNQTQIIAIASIILLQSALIVALLFERRNRRRSEIALRESEERAEIAGVSLGVGFWTWQPDSDQVWTTRQCAWLIGTQIGKPLTLDELLRALRQRSDREEDTEFAHAVKSGTAFDGELPVEGNDGSVRWIVAAIRPSADSRGRRHITGVLMDVTARKTAELTAAEQLRELSHLGRVAMLGEMSGALSHELRQPLSAILTYAQGTRRLVDQTPADVDKIRHGLDAIIRAEKHASNVIDRIRALLKRSDPQPEPLHINDVVSETLDLAAVELRSRAVAPSMYLAHGLPAVFGDRIQLQQVLINLVLNACDAMSAVAPARRRLAVTTWYHEKMIQILVRDAGTGIAEDRVDRIFEPFMTTKQDGLGLGLAICYSIVQAHGGEIRAANNPEGGSTFQVLLPRIARESNYDDDVNDASAGEFAADHRG